MQKRRSSSPCVGCFSQGCSRLFIRDTFTGDPRWPPSLALSPVPHHLESDGHVWSTDHETCSFGTLFTGISCPIWSRTLYPLATEMSSVLFRHEIFRGFFHRVNRILLRKSQIFDLDTILYSPYYVKKSFKTGPSRSMEKSPNDPLPALVTRDFFGRLFGGPIYLLCLGATSMRES